MKIFRTAILLVHGFAGGVYDEEYLNHQLELIPNYDVFTFTLPGHDGNTSKKITGDDWIKKSESEIEFLITNGYNRIYVFGHSMGGVIAAYLASKYKEVKKLVLVAPAFRYISHEDGNFKPLNAIKKTPKLVEQYGTKMITSRMTKLPANATKEFMNLVDKYQDVTQNIFIPTLIIRGTNDEIVPSQSVEYILDTIKSKKKKAILLDKITHDVFREEKKDIATKLIIKFFKHTSLLEKMPDIIK